MILYERNIFFILILVCISCQTDVISEVQNLNDQLIIADKFSLKSEALDENREIFVSLPSNYNRNIHSYPIIFVLDAEYLFEITNSIVKIKVSRNEMPESIIVGIPNNTGKRSDMALKLVNSDGRKFFGENGGKSKEYLNFFRKELFQFMKDNFRVNSSRTIIGMSPTFGPVLEAFWSEPDLFNNYIVLAAEFSLMTDSGETIAQKLLTSIQDSLHPAASIYLGKADEDLERRPAEEVQAIIKLNQKLELTANPKINCKVEILENENHYGMCISGIQNGLETIYPAEIWKIPYRDFWKSTNPADEIKLFYDSLSILYEINILPLEDSFYSGQTLLGTIRRLERQGKLKELKEVLELAIEYYPNSIELKKIVSRNNKN